MKKFVGILLVVSFVVGCSSQGAYPPARPVLGSTNAASAVVLASSTPTRIGPTAPPAATAAAPTFAQLIGQKLVVRMEGVTPTADLLGRIRRGEVGGVILFGSNVTTRTALIALTAKLRAAAVAGGQPHLLIAVD